jgi:hypothetical protein
MVSSHPVPVRICFNHKHKDVIFLEILANQFDPPGIYCTQKHFIKCLPEVVRNILLTEGAIGWEGEVYLTSSRVIQTSRKVTPFKPWGPHHVSSCLISTAARHQRCRNSCRSVTIKRLHLFQLTHKHEGKREREVYLWLSVCC